MPPRLKHGSYYVQRGMHPSLSKTETWLYIGLWIYALSRAMYTAYRSAVDYRPYFSDHDFIPGWKLFNREKDVGDYEWTVWSVKFIRLIPWCVCHIVVSQLLWWRLPQYVSSFYTLFSAVCLLQFIGWLPTLFLFFQPLLMFAVHFSRSRTICWVTGLVFLFSVNLFPFTQLREFIVPSFTETEYVVSVIMAWLNTRCLSFCLHRCSEARKEEVTVWQDFARFLGFCFYFPLLFTGPLMMFDDFETQMDEPKPKWTVERILNLSFNFVRYTFWFVCIEAFVHYVYISSLHTYPHLVKELSAWGICGLAFTTAQFFMVKYVVMYGLTATVARIENYDPPDKPKCVARIHLYSDMWRYFDQGLYKFLKRYIYIPACGDSPSTLRKLLASAATFVFIYVWHGTSYFIFLWAVLNYVGLVMEVVATSISSTETFVKVEEAWLSPQWSRRLRAAVATPLVSMSVLSNFYFLLGYDVGTIIMERTVLHAPLFNIVVTSFFMYCMCQVSIEAKNWELRKLQKNKGT